MGKPNFFTCSPTLSKGSRYQKLFGTKNVCTTIVYNFVPLRHFAEMTQFRKFGLVTPVLTPGTQWVDCIKNPHLQKLCNFWIPTTFVSDVFLKIISR